MAALLLLLLAALCSPITSEATVVSEPTSVSSETGCVTGMVAAHNAKRCLHPGTPDLEWDNCLASCAQAWSDAGDFQHSPNSGRCSQCNLGSVGENLAVGYATVDMVLKGWYDDEEVGWDYTTSTGSGAGHMTQVVWAATTKVGCGYNPTGWDSGGGRPFWTCNYATAGNYNNAYSTNVRVRDDTKLEACDPCHGTDCAGSSSWQTRGFCSRPSGECHCREGYSGPSCTAVGGSGWEDDCSGGWPAANTSSEPTPSPNPAPATSEPTPSPNPAPATSEPTTSPLSRFTPSEPVTTEPTTAPTNYCPAGYDDIAVRWNWGIGKIIIAANHTVCSARCTKYSGPQYLGGCKGYMTGMYFGMLYCRSYGGELRTTPCAPWAHPSAQGDSSGALGSIHGRTGNVNIGGNCCQNMTFVPTGR